VYWSRLCRSLSNNSISVVANEAFDGLTALQTLYVSMNCIPYRNSLRCSSWTIVHSCLLNSNISRNQLKKVPNLQASPSLRNLDMSDNPIVSLQANFYTSEMLTYFEWVLCNCFFLLANCLSDVAITASVVQTLVPKHVGSTKHARLPVVFFRSVCADNGWMIISLPDSPHLPSLVLQLHLHRRPSSFPSWLDRSAELWSS
jgi:Leucine-rich repeat (LRR) protein